MLKFTLRVEEKWYQPAYRRIDSGFHSFRQYDHLMLKKKYARTNILTLIYSYFRRIVDSWNILPVDICTAYCTGNFKFKVKEFLISKS